MAAQAGVGQVGQVVLGRGCADHRAAIADHGDIAFAIRRQVEARAHFVLGQRHGDAGGVLDEGDDGLRRGARAAYPDAHETAQRAVVAHESIGYRADHPGLAGAEFGIENVLQVDDLGRAVGLRLIVHAVVGSHADDRAQFGKTADLLVDAAVELVRHRVAGRVLVLDVVGQRKEQHVGFVSFQQLDAGFENEQRKVHRVHVGLRHADQIEYVLDAVLGQGAAVGELGRKADVAARQVEVLAQLLPQLVLGGNRYHLGPGVGEDGQNRLAAQQFRAGHHHRLAGLVEVIVAGDAMHRSWRASDQRHVVRAGEAGHRAVGDGVETFVHEAGEVGQDAVAAALLEVGGIAAIDTDDDHRLTRPLVSHAVEFYSFHVVRWRVDGYGRKQGRSG